MQFRRHRLLGFLLFTAMAGACDCGGSGGEQDAGGLRDASYPDASEDTGVDSGGTVDAASDAVIVEDATTDAGPASDASADASAADAVEDAGHEDATEDAGPEDATEDARVEDAWIPEDAGTHANLVFVTSSRHVLGEIGGLGGADAICDQRAREAGLFGTFVAWLSDDQLDARERLGNARGWERTDGKPFADTIAGVVSGTIFHPPRLDEQGNDVGVDGDVATGTRPDGTRHAAGTCGSWSSSDGTTVGGHAHATSDIWTLYWYPSCSGEHRLYCFGVDLQRPVTPIPESGRLAFVSSAPFAPDSGTSRSTADDLCQAEADAAGHSGRTFIAMIAATYGTPVSRFNTAGPTWVRADGVTLTTTTSQLFDGSLLDAPLNVTLSGDYLGNRGVWTGSTDPASASTSSNVSCGSWTNSSSSGHAGVAAFTSADFFNRGLFPCTQPAMRVYCLEQ